VSRKHDQDITFSFLKERAVPERSLRVNSKLQFDNRGVASSSSRNSGVNGSTSRINSGLSIDLRALHAPTERKEAMVSCGPSTKEVPLEPTAVPGRGRRLFFRALRLGLSGALLSSVAFYTRDVVEQTVSEQAYINGEITGLRAPIGGELHLNTAAGNVLRAGETLFSVENKRFGNQEVASQLNWVSESTERLAAESEEAALLFRQQEEVYRINQQLYDEQVLSRLALLEEKTKLETARAAMTNKRALAAQAQDRSRRIKEQVELQRTALVKMPFDGVAWAVPAKNGAEVSTHETVLEILNPERIWVDAFFTEKQAPKLSIGRTVQVRTRDGTLSCEGTVEWVRAGVGRIPPEGGTAVNPGEQARRRVAVRVRLKTDGAFSSSEFFGVGRNVIVTLASHE
jgi:multidrug resistance efflux pump